MTTIDLALLVIRVMLGTTFILHGSQKLFGWFGGAGMTGITGMMNRLNLAHPVLLAWMAALSEFGGGVLILLGLLTPLAAALIVSTMIVAIATVHIKNGFFVTKSGYEFNLNLIAMSIALMLTGAGTASVDQLLGIAYRIDQLPLWASVFLVLVPFGGIISIEIAKRVKTGHETNVSASQQA